MNKTISLALKVYGIYAVISQSTATSFQHSPLHHVIVLNVT